MRTKQSDLHKPATIKDEQALYHVPPSFVDMLPWVEFLRDSRCLLLDDGRSVAAVIELQPLGTEGRDAAWLQTARDAVENALQDSFDELDHDPWVLQLYVQDETDWDSYLSRLEQYIHVRARGTAFTKLYQQLIAHHLHAVSKPGGLFHDNAVTRLPWRGQTRRVRLVVYRRLLDAQILRELMPEDALNSTCDRLSRGLANAGIVAHRLNAQATRDWLLRWFNPSPTLLGSSAEERRRFFSLTSSSDDGARDADELPLASGTDFAQSLFYSQPRSDGGAGVWYFDDMPHRVLLVDRLRKAPTIGHLTGEGRHSGDAINAAFDHMPEGTVLCLTLVVTPQDTLEAHLNYLSKKSVGETLDSEQTRHDVQQARSLIGSAHKLYRGSIAVYLRGHDLADLERRTGQAANVLLSAGLQPVREGDEVGPLNSYLRSMPCCYDPATDRRHWYAQLMFAQHFANLAPLWGRSRGTGNPGLTFFNRGGGTITVDPLSRNDRQMNAHLLLVGPTGAGKSATLNYMLHQVTAIYRPRLFIVEAGNSFGLFGQFAERLGLTVNRVKLAPNSGVSLAPFADAVRLVLSPAQVQTLDVDALDEPFATDPAAEESQQRDVLGELEITARLMITGGEAKEEARMTRADRSLLRQCILDAARSSVDANAPVLPASIRDALRNRAQDSALPEPRRARLLEMADAMDMFCQGVNAQLFNRPGTPWPEADATIVDLATFAREGYSAEMSVAYISLVNAVNNIAERDQFSGRPIVFATDEGHIITKNPLTAPFVVKITKMWRKLMAWFWLATQGLTDFPDEAKALLNMIEWWICLNMPPEEVETIARFRELTPSQKELMLSARKEPGKFTEGVILSKSMELLFRAVLPSIHLALAMTEGEEKHRRYELMKEHTIEELDAALMMAAQIDRDRGIDPLPFDLVA